MSSTAVVTADEIERALRDALAPQALVVRNDSAAHAGHAGAGQGSHWAVQIVSDRFRGLPTVARHRLVYDALRLQMARGIHALSIDATAPAP